LRIEVVESENVNGSFDAQKMKLTLDVQAVKVFIAQVVKHAAVEHAFAEVLFVLR
jgi:hypothetical protein